MNPTVVRFLRHYLVGMLASMWNGGIGAVAGIMGINGASLSGVAPEARVLNMEEMLSAFAGAVVIHGIFWLKSHPMPENFGTRSPFWASVKESAPSAPVKATS